MIAIATGATRADQVQSLVRALGAHRYVAGRLHLVHAFAFASIPDDAGGALGPGREWARAVLGSASIDPASRDEALWRTSSDAEVGAVLDAFWAPGPRARAARDALQSLLARHDLSPAEHAPFDESAEAEMHPLLVDAGWELVPLQELDPERHKGARGAYGSELAFASACFEEETATPPRPHLYELPAMGPAELLRGAADDGTLAEPLVLWVQADETYVDYVLRGVRRAAKLPEADE